jgi:hypothetical protein
MAVQAQRSRNVVKPAAMPYRSISHLARAQAFGGRSTGGRIREHVD